MKITNEFFDFNFLLYEKKTVTIEAKNKQSNRQFVNRSVDDERDNTAAKKNHRRHPGQTKKQNMENTKDGKIENELMDQSV